MEDLERFIKPAIVIAVVALICVVGYFGYQMTMGTSYSNGLFKDNRYGFSMQLSPEWREMTSDEEGMITKSQRYNWDINNRFFATISSPAESAFFVIAIDEDQNVPVEMVHKGMVQAFGSTPRTKVQLDEVESIGGFEVHRVGIQFLEMQYLEMIFFKCDKGVIMIGFQVMEPVSDQMFSAIDASVASLTRL